MKEKNKPTYFPMLQTEKTILIEIDP